MVAEGETLPAPIEDDVLPSYDPADYHAPIAVLVPVADRGRAVRLSVSLDQALHARLKNLARETGTTTAALVARGARLIVEREGA